MNLRLLLLPWALAASVVLLPVPASAQVPADIAAVRDCLDLQDVDCAAEAAKAAGLSTRTEGAARALSAELAHWQGDHPEALERIQQAVELGFADAYDWQALYERTLYATAGWVEVAKGRFRVRFRPGFDVVLLKQIVDVLETTDARVVPRIGPTPPGSTMVEIYPDGRSFIAASGLTYDDVLATGVVAISKWARLLVTSPRVRSGGYPWRSTLSHEYLHLVVSHATADKAPVWLQEAIARHLDHAFETDDLSPSRRDEALLAEALENDDFVSFDEMRISLAKIKVYDENGDLDAAASGKRSALAYAQLASLLSYAYRQGGDDLLLRVLPRVKAGDDPGVALAEEAGLGTFERLQKAWLADLRGQRPEDGPVAVVPTILDGGSEAELDPVLARRQDLANHLRLGDLLRHKGRAEAALAEYGKAVDPDEPDSPLLASKVALTHLTLHDEATAAKVLAPALRDYPEISHLHEVMGTVHEAQGATEQAVGSYTRALELDPFDVATRQAQLAGLEKLGDTERAAQAEATLAVFAKGGGSANGRVLHNQHGQFELPRSGDTQGDGAEAPRRSRLKHQPAPNITFDLLGGGERSLSELRGNVVVLDFWATWCGPCVRVMPELSQLAVEHADDGLVVVGISNETAATVQRFLARQEAKGVTYDHLLALEDGSARAAFGVKSLPTLAIVDRSGKVDLVHVGAGSFHEVRETVRQALAEPPPSAGSPSPENPE